MLDWSNHTAVVLASGPSLTQGDCDLVSAAPVKTIVVNATFRLAPWADVVYMGDMAAIRQYNFEVTRTTTAQRWTCCAASAQRYGWSRALNVSRGGNSGHQAIHLATLFGARRVILLGFDMQAAPDGRRHWHPEHPKPLVQRSLFPEWKLKMAKLAKSLDAQGVDVSNCSRVTALECLPRRVLEQELALCHSQS